MNTEIERKFLIKTMPDLRGLKKLYIEQCYMSFEPQVRLRKVISRDIVKFYQTVKGTRVGISAPEYEIEISRLTHLELFEKKISDCICKQRYIKHLYNYYPDSVGPMAPVPIVAEIDIFSNIELQLVEVEFPSIEAATRMQIPHWFGREVTDDPYYKNKNLVKLVGQESK